MDYKHSYELWLSDPYFDEATKAELKAIENDDVEIMERFHKNLEFGTGGLRGILGAGTNRMNIHTVRMATQGLANYIIKHGKNHSVAIAHDSRRMSPEFCKEAALVLCANGIKAYVFDSLRPTPQLSFTVRLLNCDAGIVVTASHNPPEYNGYKVYWSDGAQVNAPMDREIIDEVNAITDFSQIKTMDEATAAAKGLYNVLGADADEDYFKQVITQSLATETEKAQAKNLTVVYTPLNGAGRTPVMKALEAAGFDVHIVKEQAEPDGDFPTIGYPNPEDPKAFTLGIKLAKSINADIIVATDPDSDRMGAMVKDKMGEYTLLTGNMTGTLLCEYILSTLEATGKMPNNPAIISTIVSTNLTRLIADAYHATYFDVLTGFKYIGEKIKGFEETHSHSYVFGFEESYGYLSGTYARDKDAVGASLLICELAAKEKSAGRTLVDTLADMYKKYGYHKESVESITLKGIDGTMVMAKMMANLRQNPPKELGGLKITGVRDYLTGYDNLPKSDVLYFDLEGGGFFAIRPSGTEPKIKIYVGVVGKDETAANALHTSLTHEILELAKKAQA